MNQDSQELSVDHIPLSLIRQSLHLNLTLVSFFVWKLWKKLNAFHHSPVIMLGIWLWDLQASTSSASWLMYFVPLPKKQQGWRSGCLFEWSQISFRTNTCTDWPVRNSDLDNLQSMNVAPCCAMIGCLHATQTFKCVLLKVTWADVTTVWSMEFM